MRRRGQSVATRRLSDDQRVDLALLLDAVPAGAVHPHPALVALCTWYRADEQRNVPWWAPAAAADYMIELGWHETALERLRSLLAIEDWGEQPSGRALRGA